MCGCFRRDDAADPVIYASALVAVMEDYPIEVVEFVTDPRRGIPRTMKFLPTVAEVADACDKAAEELRRMREPSKPSLGNPVPPSPVNPNMWNDPIAKARHERPL